MSFRIKILNSDEGDLEIWEGYYQRLADKAVYHQPGYLKFLEDTLGGRAELFLFESGRHFIYYPYFVRPLDLLPLAKHFQGDLANTFDLVSSWYYGGALANAPDLPREAAAAFAAEFSRFASSQNYVTEFVRLDPNLGNKALYPARELIYSRPTFYVDLTQSEEQILAGFSGGNRRAVKKARAQGLRVCAIRQDREKFWHLFHEVYQEEMVRKDAPDHLYFSLDFFVEMDRGLSDNCLLLAAMKGDEFCGGFVVAYDQNYAFHFLSASWPDYWPMRVNNLMYSEAVLWAKKNGMKVFDFMGGRPGVARFKANFTRTQGKFYLYQKVHMPELYAELNQARLEAAKNETNPAKDYFPLYRA